MVFPCASGKAAGIRSVSKTDKTVASSFGFTVVELLVVLAAIGLLLSIAAPRYIQHLERAKEVALKQNLHEMRDAIDKFYSDNSRYPTALQELVERRYLRAVPEDPLTQRTDTWVLVAPKTASGEGVGVFDVRTGEPGRSQDGSSYASW